MQITSPSWTEFYRNRINSSYQEYFNRRYKPLIDLILSEEPSSIREEGVGIGSVSKALNSGVERKYGFDLCSEMLELCTLNNPEMILYRDDIVRPMVENNNPDIIVTHGVLEHFHDHLIHKVFARYRRDKVKNIHYVPTSGYDAPTFGDERLLHYSYWLNEFKPKDHLLFNL